QDRRSQNFNETSIPLSCGRRAIRARDPLAPQRTHRSAQPGAARAGVGSNRGRVPSVRWSRRLRLALRAAHWARHQVNPSSRFEEKDVAKLGLVRPPLVYLISLVTGALIQIATPLPFLPRTLALPLGAPLVVLAIALFSYSVAKFRGAGTPVPARKPTTVIVRSGPYSFSRNPIYLAFSL